MATNEPTREAEFREMYSISREWLETLNNADLGALRNCMKVLSSDAYVFRRLILGAELSLILSLEAGPLFVYARESIENAS